MVHLREPSHNQASITSAKFFRSIATKDFYQKNGLFSVYKKFMYYSMRGVQILHNMSLESIGQFSLDFNPLFFGWLSLLFA
jgi:hypothetical protein